MAENTWEHKGHTIELMPQGKFRTQIRGGFYLGQSLSAAKKAIDKDLEQKAEEVKLELPVLMLVKLSGNQERYTIQRGTITGINRETLHVQGLFEGRYSNRTEFVLPDLAINEKLLAEYITFEKALKALKEKIDAREVPMYLSGSAFGGKTTYAEAVKRLQDGYEKAKKGKAE